MNQIAYDAMRVLFEQDAQISRLRSALEELVRRWDACEMTVAFGSTPTEIQAAWAAARAALSNRSAVPAEDGA